MRSFLFFQTRQPTPLLLRPTNPWISGPEICAVVLTPLTDDKRLLKYRNSATASSFAQVKVLGKEMQSYKKIKCRKSSAGLTCD